MNFFYPLPNQGTLANGYGVFQQFVPETRNRERADLRHRPRGHARTTRSSCAASYQHRDPNADHSSRAATPSPTCGILDRNLNTAAVIAGWTRIFSSTVVNEFRVGLQLRQQSRGRAPTTSHDVNAAARSRERAERRPPDRRRLPGLHVLGGAAANRPINIATAAATSTAPSRQNAFSISDNLTWIMGGHSLKAGALWNRNIGHRRPRHAASTSAAATTFNGGADRQRLRRLPARLTRDARRPGHDNRGTLDGHSNDFAVFVQDDWKVSRDLTVFLGLRYEIVGRLAREGRHPRQLRARRTAATTWCRTRTIAALLPPGRACPRPHPDRRPTSACPTPSSTPTRTTSARASASPGGSGGDNKTVLRGGFGLFHPTVAVQGVRDLLATNMFRYGNTRRGAPLAHGFSGGHALRRSRGLRQPGHRPEHPEPGHLPVQPDPGARAAGRPRPARELHRLHDAQAARRPATSTPCRRAPRPSTPTNPDDYARLPFPLYGNYMDQHRQNRGSGQFHAAPDRAAAALRGTASP